MPYYHSPNQHPDGSPNFYGGGPYQDDAPAAASSGNHRRRKRQQRLAHHNSSDGGFQGRGHPRRRNSGTAVEQQQQLVAQQGAAASIEKRGRRRRWNYSDGAASSESDPSFRNNNSNKKRNNASNNNNNRRRNRRTALASSSSDGGSASWITKKKQKQQKVSGDENLLGKTGSSALYEWCDRQKIKPVFECKCVSTLSSSAAGKQESKEHSSQTSESGQSSNEEEEDEDESSLSRISTRETWYEMKVYIDGIAMGEGRGSTKTGAKHSASRNALQVLFPGVKFDQSSGIIVKIPVEIHTESSSRLSQWSATAVSRQKKPAAAASSTSSCLDDLAPNLAKQLAIGHPDDEEDTANDESSDPNFLGLKRRGQWPFVYPGTSTNSDDEDDDAYWASRGASVCSSLLHAMIQIDDRLSDPPEYFYEVTNVAVEGKVGNTKLKRKVGGPLDGLRYNSRGAFQCTGLLTIRVSKSTSPKSGSLEATMPRESYQMLRAKGFGATKRESRHIVAAKLLALLFPECDGMAQVKQAAEAARERYAASRLLKQESKHDKSFTAVPAFKNDSPTNASDCISPSFGFAMPPEGTPAIPEVIEVGLASAMGYGQNDHSFDDTAGAVPSELSGHIRQLSRQQQLEERVTSVLQLLNEHDGGGRSRPEELTVDDVGRT
ncbi:MAG: hypothetical protein SGARI_002582, partial [Bacillariaceae sp.]